ncbi:MAG: type ISP restriction/modification enzyme, partial [Promethearchaeota archaeon]
YDDYVKFIRYGQWLIDQHGQGILAFVTNRKFLDGKIYYGMRRSLMKSFDEIYVIDLFGDQRNVKSEGGSINLFGIQTGICIGIFIKKRKEKKDAAQELAPIYYRAVKGKTQGKIESQLNHLNASFNPSVFQKITPIEPKYIFIPSPMKLQWAKLWNESIPLPECFRKTSRAMISSRDRFMIHPDAEVLAENLALLERRDFAELRARGKIRKKQTSQDPLLENEEILQSFDLTTMRNQIFPITYRPFDAQSCIYYTINRRCGKSIILDHLRPNHKALVFVQSMQRPPFNHVFITQGLVDSGLFGYSTAKVAPFLIAGKSNLSEKIQEPIYKFAPDATDEEILGYIYGILQWPLYGTIFEPRLLHEFPRIIIPKSKEMHSKVSKLGMKLINLCTSFKDEIKNQPCIENFALKSWKYDPATEDLILTGMDFSTRKRKEQKIHCIEEIWNYTIGSIRIIEHWLKYRKMTFLNRPWEKKEWSFLDSSIRIIAHFLEIRDEISKHLSNFL